MRKGKRSKINGQAWLFGLAVPAVALFMLFSLLPYDRMTGHWPLGIGQEEVMAFQELFDHRPGQHVEGQAELFTLTDQGNGQVSVATAEATAEARLVPVGGGASFMLEFPGGAEFRGASAMAFTPADLHSLTALYAGAVADSLPVLAPPVALVKVARDGGKAVPCLMQEVVTADHVLRHAGVAMALIGADGSVEREERSAPGDTIGGTKDGRLLRADRFDTAATAAMGLLACAEQRIRLCDGEAGALYDRVTGGIVPLYRMAQGPAYEENGILLSPLFREALSGVAVQRGIVRLAEQLRKDSAAWAARLLAIDSAAVPVLAKGRNIGLVQAEVDRARGAFLQRLFHPGPERFIGPPAEARPKPSIALDPWLAQFRTQPDTLRFVRGKYDIDHDLVIPPGMAVVLEKGTRWFMAAGVSVVVNGELHMRGTDLNPVFIRPQDGAAPWGAIAVNGDGGTRVRIRGLRISGGSDLLADGVYHGGMLSFIGTDAALDNCAIGEAFGAATVSAKRGTFRMADCYLSDAHQGYVGLAEIKGTLDRCGFGQPAAGRADGRSGVNMRASRMEVRGCTFADMPFTALRLARESGATVANSRFTGNAVAMQAVDGSSARVHGSTFSGNGKVFVLRRERMALGGAAVKEEGNTFTGNAVLKDVDAASKLEGGAADGGQ